MEPENVAVAAAKMGLEHIVITSVDRDDLPDGGASQFVKVIEALRRNTPKTTIEILTPDFRNKVESAVEIDYRSTSRCLQPQPRNRAKAVPDNPSRCALLCFAALARKCEAA